MAELSGKKMIVVPESLAADGNGRATDQPSFVYRQVLDYVLAAAGPNDQVYLAPANAFGGPVTEEQAAYHYLMRHQSRFTVFCPGVNLPAIVDRPAYVDTWDNAVLLGRVIDRREGSFELVTTWLHAERAQWCFARVGFDLSRVHAVRYVVERGHFMWRNFYYRYPRIHWVYEMLARWRDRLKYGP